MVENSRGWFRAVKDAQVNEFDIELQGWTWKSNVKSPTGQKEHKAEETPSLVFICCGDIYLILLPPDSL